MNFLREEMNHGSISDRGLLAVADYKTLPRFE